MDRTSDPCSPPSSHAYQVGDDHDDHDDNHDEYDDHDDHNDHTYQVDDKDKKAIEAANISEDIC